MTRHSRSRIVGSAAVRARRAVACALVVSLTACSGSGNKIASTRHAATPHGAAPVPQLTVAQARSVFTAFLPKFDRLGSDPSLASQLTTWPETTAWALAQPLQTGVEPAGGTLSGERFLIPYLAAFPRWFLVAGWASSQRAFMFVMVQQAAGAAWREAAAMYDVYQPPQIMADLNLGKLTASGYARPVAATDVSLTAEPSALSSRYAQYLNNHAQGSQPDFLAGAYTTYYVKITRQLVAGAKAAGWAYAETQAGLGEPTFALRLANGGALVSFYTKDVISWTARSSSAVTSPGTPGSGYAPPPDLLSALRVKAVRPGMRVSLTVIDENLAIVAPAGTQGVAIIVNDPKAVSYSKI